MPENTSKDIVIDLAFTPQELEKMLANARVGGAVQVKVKLDIAATGTVSEVILR